MIEIPDRITFHDLNDPLLQERYQGLVMRYAPHINNNKGDQMVTHEDPSADMFLETKIEHNAPSQCIGRTGCCMYCGSLTRSSRKGKLSAEHFIPEGIGSRLYIDNATCEHCDALVQRYENYVISKSLSSAGAALGLRTKKKRKVGCIEIYIDDSSKKIKVPIPEAPVMLLLPNYLQPRLLTADLPGRSRYRGLWRAFVQGQENIEVFFKAIDLAELVFPHLDVFAYAQFFAKIAYGYAVAKLGFTVTPKDGSCELAGYRCNILQYVVGAFSKESFDTGIFDYVGAEHIFARPTNYLHEIGHGFVQCGLRELLVVHIRLFSYAGTHIYKVVVGEKDL